VTSKQELRTRIELYLKEVNEEPTVFKWKYKLETLATESVASPRPAILICYLGIDILASKYGKTASSCAVPVVIRTGITNPRNFLHAVC
jgi:hypothetical protein